VQQDLDELRGALITANRDVAVAAARRLVDAGVDPTVILESGMAQAMFTLGEMWKRGEVFLPEVVASAEIFKQCNAIVQPVLLASRTDAEAPQLVVLATVKGDLHDLGKNMVGAMLRTSGFEVLDLGKDVPAAGWKSQDAIDMAAIAHGGRDVIEGEPALMIVVNPNSPLIWDTRMVQALLVSAEANQPIVVTPFLLAGGTAPVTMAAALSIQVAEALSGVALAQLVRAGVACLFGSFFTALDMRTGSPAFGMPEALLAILAGRQLADRYGLPYRGGGGFSSANVVDGQAAAESVASLWATMLAGTDFVLHAAGWLEGGLVASYEKLAFDLEVLRQMERIRQGIAADEGELAFDAIAEAGPGALFLASPHTMARFKDSLYMSPTFLTTDFATWDAGGRQTVESRSNQAWKQLLESYVDPGLDDAVDEELRTFMVKRREEIPRRRRVAAGTARGRVP
jgi:hypothetical protein